jgi:hypothetical protein
MKRTLCGALYEVSMVVGRTIWDFASEVLQMPGRSIFLLVVLIFLELIIIMLLLMQNGLIGVKISYGGLGVELHHLTDISQNAIQEI